MRHIYELLTIWPGGEYVHMRTEDLHVISARYNRCRAQDVAIRIRKDGTILTIGEADELCGDPWGLVPEYKRPKVRSARPAVAVKAPPKKRKSVAEMDADGRIVRKFHSICGMAEALNIGNNTAGAWVRSGGIQATGFQYAVCCDDEQG